MAEIHFTSHLRNLVPAGPLSAAGTTVGEALTNLFAAQPHVRGYVLDDRGDLPKHVCIFADGERLAHEGALTRQIGPVGRLIQSLVRNHERSFAGSDAQGIVCAGAQAFGLDFDHDRISGRRRHQCV